MAGLMDPEELLGVVGNLEFLNFIGDFAWKGQGSRVGVKRRSGLSDWGLVGSE
jgi:hypothetical protein